MNIIIRKYEEKDREKLAEIWYEASRQNHSFISEELLIKQKGEVLSKYLPEAESWVAVGNDEVLGFISLLDKYIGGLFISPIHQRKGIGTLLIDKVKSEKGSLAVGVYEKNLPARKFYEKLGFKYVNKELQDETNEYVLNMVLNR